MIRRLSCLRIISSHASGMTSRDISAKWGVTYSYVRQVIRQTRYGWRINRRYLYAPMRREQFLLMQEYIKTYAEIMEER